MKRFIVSAALMLAVFFMASAQSNSKAEEIVGHYELTQGGDHSKVNITQNKNGSFKCQIEWVENDKDKNGKKRLDEKNPDKSLRTVPCDRIVLFDGLVYNAQKKQWDGTKIYDPQRGLRTNITCSFTKEGKLEIKAKVLGIGETLYWTKLKEEK